MQYRLHIDIPVGTDEEAAIEVTKKLMNWCFLSEGSLSDMDNFKIEQINYRLGHDEDRQRSNYLDKNENGHVSNKKTKVKL
tara:strand:+ start:397 stop:639 length:243 start_codon:yes stop_codon:yes gene_type:complete